MATQTKSSKPKKADPDKLELWVVKLTGPGNYRTWKDQMENFLRMKQGLLKLVKGETAPLTTPAVPSTYKEDQFAFEKYLRDQLAGDAMLPAVRELDMHYKTYQV